MYDYTRIDKSSFYSIEYVDYDLELMGLTIDKLIYCMLIFLLSTRFFGPICALIITFLYAFLMNKIYKMELQGKPITFNPKIQKYLRIFPRIFRDLTYIELAQKSYRS